MFNIKAGEIICVDDPTVSMLCPEKKDNVMCHCLHCFRATRAPLPCDVSLMIACEVSSLILRTYFTSDLLYGRILLQKMQGSSQQFLPPVRVLTEAL